MPRRTDDDLRIAPEEATDRQLLVAIYKAIRRTEKQVSEIGENVSDIEDAVRNVEVSVDGVALRVGALVQELEAARGDDAAVDRAVSKLRGVAATLNALGTDPATPIDPNTEPVEPPEIVVPPEDVIPDEPLPTEENPA